LTQQLKQSSLFLRSKHIAFYLANDGEIDLQPLIQQAWAMGKQCYLPVLCPAFHKRLWFAPYQAETPMQRNIFGILEPRLPWRDMRPIFSLDLILTPLVAFDLQGNRLGMGGGFYDRSLAYLQQRRYWRKPRLVGTAYEFQQVAQLPKAVWDVPLHGVITEQCSYIFSGNQ
jgi:5-formyltetrahydrofolate cyclo-ligase